MGTREMIDTCLRGRRLAFVGVSHNPHDFSRRLFSELRARDYDVVPVNPNADEIEGEQCYAQVQDIPEAVDWALIMTPPKVTEKIVRDCAEAEIRRVWLHKGSGHGAMSNDAVVFCEDHHIEVVAGHCPFMFLPNGGVGHKMHAILQKVAKTYPKYEAVHA